MYVTLLALPVSTHSSLGLSWYSAAEAVVSYTAAGAVGCVLVNTWIHTAAGAVVVVHKGLWGVSCQHLYVNTAAGAVDRLWGAPTSIAVIA